MSVIVWGVLVSFLAGTACAEVVVVVSAQQPIRTLSRTELTDIYLGRMNRLANGDPVVPIDQRESTSAHKEFYSRYLRQSPAQIKAHWSRLIFTGRGQPPQTVPNGSAMADLVAKAPHAIGYLDPSLVDERLRVVSIE